LCYNIKKRDGKVSQKKKGKGQDEKKRKKKRKQFILL